MGSIRDLMYTLTVTVLVVWAMLTADRCSTREEGCRQDTVSVTVRDTVRLHEPTAKDSAVTAHVKVKLPLESAAQGEGKKAASVPENAKPVPENAESVPENAESAEKCTEDAAKGGDSVVVSIPITQRVYEDSLYTAYVSGYMARLDSLELRTSRQTVNMGCGRRCRPRRWSIGLQAGYGLGLGGKPRLEPYIGIGITYNLYSF